MHIITENMTMLLLHMHLRAITGQPSNSIIV